MEAYTHEIRIGIGKKSRGACIITLGHRIRIAHIKKFLAIEQTYQPKYTTTDMLYDCKFYILLLYNTVVPKDVMGIT